MLFFFLLFFPHLIYNRILFILCFSPFVYRMRKNYCLWWSRWFYLFTVHWNITKCEICIEYSIEIWNCERPKKRIEKCFRKQTDRYKCIFFYFWVLSLHISFIFQSFCCTIREKKNEFSDAIKVISRIKCVMFTLLFISNYFGSKIKFNYIKCVVSNIEFLSGYVYIHLLCITKYKPELMREKNAYNWGMKHSVFFYFTFFPLSVLFFCVCDAFGYCCYDFYFIIII